MNVVTWNVNSIRARLPRVLEWVDANQPDVLCLQEIKCVEGAFPLVDFATRGYLPVMNAQPTYNGVAILSRRPLESPECVTFCADNPQARHVAATIDGIRIVNLYVPNGKAVGAPHFAYKLRWLDELREWLGEQHTPTEPLVVCGDFNIAPEDRDVYDPDALRELVLCSTPERERFQRLTEWGLIDAFRSFSDAPGQYTWWDYRQGMFRRGMGLRIDHHLITPAVAKRASDVRIDRSAREGEKPSDHAPVTLVLT